MKSEQGCVREREMGDNLETIMSKKAVGVSDGLPPSFSFASRPPSMVEMWSFSRACSAQPALESVLVTTWVSKIIALSPPFGNGFLGQEVCW
jgi:hypothetical protein